MKCNTCASEITKVFDGKTTIGIQATCTECRNKEIIKFFELHQISKKNPWISALEYPSLSIAIDINLNKDALELIPEFNNENVRIGILHIEKTEKHQYEIHGILIGSPSENSGYGKSVIELQICEYSNALTLYANEIKRPLISGVDFEAFAFDIESGYRHEIVRKSVKMNDGFSEILANEAFNIYTRNDPAGNSKKYKIWIYLVIAIIGFLVLTFDVKINIIYWGLVLLAFQFQNADAISRIKNIQIRK